MLFSRENAGHGAKDRLAMRRSIGRIKIDGPAESMLQQRINPEYFRCSRDFGGNNIVIFV
jgi:hypothetical protein